MLRIAEAAQEDDAPLAFAGASLLVALGGYTTLLWILAASTAAAAVAGHLAVEQAGRAADPARPIGPA